MYPPTPTPKTHSLGRHPYLRFNCESERTADRLASRLKPQKIRDDAIAKLRADLPNAISALEVAEFGPVSRSKNSVNFRYKTGAWYKIRLSIPSLSYKKDRNSIEAWAFNDAVSRALDQAAKEYAALHGDITSCDTYRDELTRIERSSDGRIRLVSPPEENDRNSHRTK